MIFLITGPRSENGGGRNHNDERGHSPEVSHSSPSENYGRGYHGDGGRSHHGGGGRGNYGGGGRSHHGGGGRGGGYSPHKEQTQPSHSFSPPPGFFSEDGPGQENYENLGNVMKEFSTRSRDGCQKVNKGDMTCYVCGDAKGLKKEECMYASNDPKNKAMAYHEVAEYSSPTASVLPAPLHATLLGQPEDSPFSIEFSDEDQQGESSTLSAAASSVVHTSTPATGAALETDNSSSKKKGSASTSSVVTVKSPSSASKAKKVTATSVASRSSKISNIKDKDKDKKKSVNSVKSTRVSHSSTVIVHERSKRSLDVDTLNKGKPVEDKNYDFDY